jgi:hypothetical protein
LASACTELVVGDWGLGLVIDGRLAREKLFIPGTIVGVTTAATCRAT